MEEASTILTSVAGHNTVIALGIHWIILNMIAHNKFQKCVKWGKEKPSTRGTAGRTRCDESRCRLAQSVQRPASSHPPRPSSSKLHIFQPSDHHCALFLPQNGNRSGSRTLLSVRCCSVLYLPHSSNDLPNPTHRPQPAGPCHRQTHVHWADEMHRQSEAAFTPP